MKEKFLNNLKRTALILLLPLVSYCLLGPLEIYAGNKREFQFGYGDFFWPFFLIAVGILAVGSVLLSLLPEKGNRIAGALILGIGTASYVQNMFMNVKLSEVNGAPMDWGSLGSFPLVNGIIYCGMILLILVLSLILKDKWNVIAMCGAGFMCAIQLVAVVSLLFTLPGDGQKAEIKLQESGEKQFQVANSENIIVFVLDTLGNAQIERVMREYPEVKDCFSDFTYYDNADCHYYVTFPSMTHMLTGEEVDFEVGASEWLQRAWESDRAVDFYRSLDEKGFECNLYSKGEGYVYGDLQNLEGKFDNVKPLKTKVDQWNLMKKMGKMSIYRYVPYWLKPRFEVLTKDFDTIVSLEDEETVVDDNGLFYQKLKEKGLSIDETMNKAFIIQHLFGVHQPYTLSADAQIVEESSQLEVGRGLVTIVNEYFNQLKELGVYDDSTIIVMADHGAWYGNDMQPICFIKEKSETHDQMHVNSGPISWDDFQATVMEIIGEDHTEYGTSFYDWKEEKERRRSVFMLMPDEKEGKIYHRYDYLTDRNELKEKVSKGPDEILPARSWLEISEDNS